MNSFAWLLLSWCAISCLASFAHENAQKIPRSRGFLISTEEVSVSDLNEHDSDGRTLVAPEKITATVKGGRGKGSNGGANIAHRRPGVKSAAVSYMPYFFFVVSSTILGFSFPLLLA